MNEECSVDQTLLEAWRVWPRYARLRLFIDVARPYIGVSPDGIISCKCCGNGLLEIKCPHCIKSLPDHENELPNFFIEKVRDKWCLKMGIATTIKFRWNSLCVDANIVTLWYGLKRE